MAAVTTHLLREEDLPPPLGIPRRLQGAIDKLREIDFLFASRSASFATSGRATSCTSAGKRFINVWTSSGLSAPLREDLSSALKSAMPTASSPDFGIRRHEERQRQRPGLADRPGQFQQLRVLGTERTEGPRGRDADERINLFGQMRRQQFESDRVELPLPRAQAFQGRDPQFDRHIAAGRQFASAPSNCVRLRARMTATDSRARAAFSPARVFQRLEPSRREGIEPRPRNDAQQQPAVLDRRRRIGSGPPSPGPGSPPYFESAKRLRQRLLL